MAIQGPGWEEDEDIQGSGQAVGRVFGTDACWPACRAAFSSKAVRPDGQLSFQGCLLEPELEFPFHLSLLSAQLLWLSG